MISILVCDDKTDELENICTSINEYYSGDCTLHRFTSAADALKFVTDKYSVDIVVLDILMPEMRGTDVAAKMRDDGFAGHILFFTSVNDFASEAFAVDASSYVLKSDDRAALWKALDKIESVRQTEAAASVTVRKRGEAHVIPLSELMYVEVRRHNLFFFLTGGREIVAYAALRDYEDVLLSAPRMGRCHKSFIVNMDFIRTLEGKRVTLINGVCISISKSYTEFSGLALRWLFDGKGK